MAVRRVGSDKKIVRRVTCRNYGSVLEYLPCDAKTKTVVCMGESEAYSWIDCPECKKQVQVKES